jgi:hypothetical protein
MLNSFGASEELALDYGAKAISFTAHALRAALRHSAAHEQVISGRSPDQSECVKHLELFRSGALMEA